MKNLNKRSASSPSLRGESITTKQSTAHSAVIPEGLCRESAVRRCRSGFTLVELVIVIAIVIILSVVSVPIYRGYTQNAKMSEGYALLGSVLSAQKAYFSQYGNFLLCTFGSAKDHQWTANDEVLRIDARGNKYYTWFCVGGYYGAAGAGDSFKYYFGAKANGTEDLEDLVLQYNITKGSRIATYLAATWQ